MPSWFEIAIIQPPTLQQHTIDMIEESLEGDDESPFYFEGLQYQSAISHRYFAANHTINHCTYNFVAMDIRWSTEGVKEWLKSIDPGGVLSVYAIVPQHSDVSNSVSSVEVTLYWEL
jgi:hypothetical protein